MGYETSKQTKKRKENIDYLLIKEADILCSECRGILWKTQFAILQFRSVS